MKLKTAIAAALFLAATAAYAQQNNFTIQRDHEDIGVENYTFAKAKNGFKVESNYHYKTPPHSDTTHLRIGTGSTTHAGTGGVVTNAPDTEDSQQQDSYNLDAGYAYVSGLLKNLNTDVSNSYGLNKDRTELTQNRMRTGKPTISAQFPFQPGGIFLPAFDASPIQALVYMATTHPAANSQYFLAAPAANQAVETGVVQWPAQPTDATGTLDGKPVTLHRYSFLFGVHEYTVYADADNALMEVDIHHPTVSLIRTGFVLDSRK
jgi:hypothetical protein